jgi:ribosomal protein S27AE
MDEPRWTLCPACGSLEIHADALTPLGQQYACPECGYEGSFVVEADGRDDARRLRDELAEDGSVPDEATDVDDAPDDDADG